MRRTVPPGDYLLLITATIWGFAFVAQRAGMEHIGPFTFNAIRFAIGATALLPLVWINERRRIRRPGAASAYQNGGSIAKFGVSAGAVLFLAASLQQIGLVYTSAGNAGFITGLYVVMVPLLGLLRRQRVGMVRWGAVLIAIVGMYLLSVTPGAAINPGDLLVLASALFFALHVQMIDHGAKRHDALTLSVIQYVVVAAASGVTARITESFEPAAVAAAAPAILYGGLGSISIAYTLQVVGQRTAEPTHAAIILSLEGTFAALGGWLLLSEYLSARALFGCALMLAGMLISQLWHAPGGPGGTVNLPHEQKAEVPGV